MDNLFLWKGSPSTRFCYDLSGHLVMLYPCLNGLKSPAWDTCAPHTSVQLHNVGFFNHCMTKRCLHNSRNVTYNDLFCFTTACTKIRDESNKNWHVMNKFGFLMKESLWEQNPFCDAAVEEVHRYVAVPTHYLKRSVRAKYFTLYFLYFLFFQLCNLFLGRGN